MAIYTAASITLGDDAAALVNPVTVIAAQAPDVGQGANSFANGIDRRTFLMFENTSGARRGLYVDVTRKYGNDAAAWAPRAFNVLAGGLFTPVLVLGVTIETAETAIMGPFDSGLFNQPDGTVTFGLVDDDGGGWGFNSNSVTGVKVGAFYLPTVDLATGATSTPPDEAPPPLVTPLAVTTLDQIIPTGILKSSMTFTGHTNTNGWNLTQTPTNGASDGMRRFVWMRNTSGGPLTVRTEGPDIEPWAQRLSSAQPALATVSPAAALVPDASEAFMGPFPASFFTVSDLIDLWLRVVPGVVEPNFDVAYVELPA